MFTVASLMSHPVFSLSRNDTLMDVRQLMDLANIRHIPVTDNDGNFEGLVTHRDLLQFTISKLADIMPEEQEELDKDILINDIMRTDVLCVNADTDLKEVATILYNHKYGCLPIVDGKKLIGIITEADFLRLTISLLENLDS